MSGKGRHTWRCMECDATGVQPSRRWAALAFERHWVAHHQEVPF